MEGLDVPMNNALIIEQDMVTVELDNFDMVSPGAISFSTLRLMLDNLLNGTDSAFRDWYLKFLREGTNVAAQYDTLSASLYFDKPLDFVRDDLREYYWDIVGRRGSLNFSESMTLGPLIQVYT